jgi:hypothetical protein
MSEVISFRLDKDNPREATAWQVLQEWIAKGFTTRQTITEALLILDYSHSESAEFQALCELSQQIKILLDNINEVSAPDIENDSNSSKDKLSVGFVTSMMETVKPGIKVD